MRIQRILEHAMFQKEIDTDWQSVSLPHTWNALDGQDGGGDYWRGTGCYQIELPDPTPGMCQYLQLDGANHQAVVFCNGTYVGDHKGGFSTFRFQLTAHLKSSGNLLEVRVNNGPSAVYPQKADFTFFGGLYRDVTFLEVPPAHFDLLKSGSTGIFLTPSPNGSLRADVFTVQAQERFVTCTVLDPHGKLVAQTQANAQDHTVLQLSVEAPTLWNGLEQPCLYTACLTLSGPNGIEDQVEERFGFRSFRVDSEQGFFLNGASQPLRGVSRHQDRWNKGWAIRQEDHQQDMELIREMGANAIRLAHYQHSSYFYNLCDENGMVVWAEIPFISQFQQENAALENTLSQMRELIAQNYNHPSICFWGISNEITIDSDSPEILENLSQLHALVKKMDPGRMSTMAHLALVPFDSPHTRITDVQGYNIYFGWYLGHRQDNGPWMDRFHRENPDKPLSISEYGADAILDWHSEAPENHDYTEEYQCLYHQELLKSFVSRPYLWGTFVWNMFDFASDNREEGGRKGCNHKGLVTYDRKTRKDCFYLYQAWWSHTPMTHLCGARFYHRAPGQRSVTVYSNCPQVSLSLNGSLVGTQTVQDHVCIFEELPLRLGENLISVKAEGAPEDRILLCGVDHPNPAYRLANQKNLTGNWFEAPKQANS